MKAEVIVLISDEELVDPNDPIEAKARARTIAERIGKPDEGNLTPALFGDGYRVVFWVDPIGANA